MEHLYVLVIILDPAEQNLCLGSGIGPAWLIWDPDSAILAVSPGLQGQLVYASVSYPMTEEKSSI